MAGAPAPPRDLGRAGRDLWRRVTSAYEVESHEVPALLLAARQLDDVARLEELLDRDGLVVAGSSGQPRLSAVVAELRLSRLAAARLLDALGLPVEGEEPSTATTTARRARRAAAARWSGHINRGERGFGDASA